MRYLCEKKMLRVSEVHALTPLARIIIDEIKLHGAMSVAQFMTHALTHSEYGYYRRNDPLGRQGDFITAPEISQMFGEMIGAWVADIWFKMGRPEAFALVECGAGRGTLLADALRATRSIEGFGAAAQVHIVEINAHLRKLQKAALGKRNVVCHDVFESVPQNMPLIILANEFLDALTFKQYKKTRSGWRERLVAFETDAFCFVTGQEDVARLVPFHLQGAAMGAVFEVSESREAFVRDVSRRLAQQSGAALFIDYGHEKSAIGDTFQAVKGHKCVDVFTDIGESDLTSHVDFEKLAEFADCPVTEIVSQGAFLKMLGIEARAAILKANASPEQARDVESGLRRLVYWDQMGGLFKVMGLYSDEKCKPAGF